MSQEAVTWEGRGQSQYLSAASGESGLCKDSLGCFEPIELTGRLTFFLERKPEGGGFQESRVMTQMRLGF